VSEWCKRVTGGCRELATSYMHQRTLTRQAPTAASTSSLTKFYFGAVLLLAVWLLVKIHLPGAFPFTPAGLRPGTSTAFLYDGIIFSQMSATGVTANGDQAHAASAKPAEGTSPAAAAETQEGQAAQQTAVADDGRRAVVFMHGLGDRGSSWSDLAQMLGLASLPGVTWHFPDSPMQAVSVNSGAVMPSWFNICELVWVLGWLINWMDGWLVGGVVVGDVELYVSLDCRSVAKSSLEVD
jgi:hypothetical protein